MTKHFNVTLSRGMIAQAYQTGETYNSHCFLLWKGCDYLPKGIRIMGAELRNGHLLVEYENDTHYLAKFYIENGHLFLKLCEEDVIMALVDLGNVIGPKGDTGATGAQGPKGDTGATGAQGAAGISPTFVLGDGTGGTIAGHLYADYDNPYTPS